jgi:hypothetical protein
LRIISQFNDDDDEYFPHANQPPGVSKGLLPSALPVGFGLNLSQLPAVIMPTLGVISPASIGPRSRPFPQSTWLLASSFDGNFGLTTTAAVHVLHRLYDTRNCL